LPSISAFLHTISPTTLPAGPITIFPGDWKLPINFPSNLKSACDISPFIVVPSQFYWFFPTNLCRVFFLSNIFIGFFEAK
jgi:hypothetical protein